MNNAAIIIACEKYNQYFDDLHGVRKDAENMRRVLSEKCACSTITMLGDTDERPATDHNIFEATITEIPSEVDNLYLYFSGHGFMNAEEEICLIPCDAIKKRSKVYGTHELKELMNNVKDTFHPKAVFVFLDMCLTPASAKGLDDTSKVFLHEGAVVFYSTLPHRPAYVAEDESGSFFTTCLVQLLDSEIRLTAAELSEKLEEKVSSLCEENGLKQIPHTSCEDTELLKRYVNFPNGEQDFLKEEAEDTSALSPIDQVLLQEFSGEVQLSEEERKVTEKCLREIQYNAGHRSYVANIGSEGEKGWDDRIANVQDNLTSVKSCLEDVLQYRDTLLDLQGGPEPAKPVLSFSFHSPKDSEDIKRACFRNANENLETDLNNLIQLASRLAKNEARLQDLLKSLAMYITAVVLVLPEIPDSEAGDLRGRLGQLRARRDKINALYEELRNYNSMLQDYNMDLKVAVNAPDAENSGQDNREELLTDLISDKLRLIPEDNANVLLQETESLERYLCS